MKRYLKETKLLNYNSIEIQDLIGSRGWRSLNEKEKIKSIYNFVKDEIKFGYNKKDGMAASEVLIDGYGQCNTKSILLMALLRAVDIACRIHGFLIDKRMQKGALTGIIYMLAPKKIVHAWTEVYFNGKWLALEGVIIDMAYFNNVKNNLCEYNGGYMGYGISVKNKDKINMCWNENSTYIQSFSITDDIGIFDNPDELFRKYNNANNKFKEVIMEKLFRKTNKRLDDIRKNK
ncbi:MAG: transglutaminase family protein [Clostridium argentinense]|uniref:Transglutaminase family protein n=1 Tax=Clostridium faecium TaxID=2762223 RepID=A0ABR8YR85_9CLOT|nr:MULTISPECIES: transglutaminase family protein [Clostridium]MBD8046523.1 transglutaminase family protein [Clostridium faecium]MBS5823004.1 transglutaminase family protein [Clostridium argentinense]MDU1349162.1 transglutaminase family protein [Clostridium argentinense]